MGNSESIVTSASDVVRRRQMMGESEASTFYEASLTEITTGKRGVDPKVWRGPSSADRRRRKRRPNCDGTRHTVLDANQARIRRGPARCQMMFRWEVD